MFTLGSGLLLVVVRFALGVGGPALGVGEAFELGVAPLARGIATKRGVRRLRRE